MNEKKREYVDAIRAQVISLAKKINIDASALRDDDVIPEMGYLDSGSIIELILWYEEFFNLSLDEEEVTLDAFGTVNAMADLAIAKLSKR